MRNGNSGDCRHHRGDPAAWSGHKTKSEVGGDDQRRRAVDPAGPRGSAEERMKHHRASLLFCYAPESSAMLGISSPPISAPNEPKGVVYTKPWVVKLVLDLAGYVPTTNLVDAVAVEPAAGQGAFLGPMIQRLVASCRNLDRAIGDCKHSIVAYEVDESSAMQARDFAREILAKEGVDEQLSNKLVHGWIRCADYLLEDWNLQADFVVGNPPYVRLEDMPEARAALYRQAYGTMRGRADLYVAFFEAALRQLKGGGVCAFICADRWMRNQYGAELRRFVTSQHSLDFLVEMHDANPFEEEVDAYPAITVIRHGKQRRAVVATASPKADNAACSTLSNGLLSLAATGTSESPSDLRAAVVGTWFKGSDPWPFRNPAQLALLRRLEERFRPLECEETQTRVGIGVATGNDEVFITTDSTVVEDSRLLRLALVEDIRSGRLEWSGHYLIDPWERDGLVNLERFPQLALYFNRNAGAIKKRNVAMKNPYFWFRTIDRVNHDLTGKAKLYIADIKDELSPVLDRGETYPHHNLYFVQSPLWDLEILGGLLLSRVAHLFVESYGVKMRGGYLRFQAQYLRRIRVPQIADITRHQGCELRECFRIRDRDGTTRVASRVYGISAHEMEQALEY